MQKELLAIFRMTLDIQRNNYSIYQNPWQFLYQIVQALTHHSYYVIYYYKLFALILKFDFVNVLLLVKFEIKFTHTSFLCNNSSILCIVLCINVSATASKPMNLSFIFTISTFLHSDPKL